MSRETEFPIHPQFTERWSPRALTGEAIELPTLLSFFEAARWAPSASNVQPWRFVYGLKGTPGFEAIFASLVDFNKGWAKNASALVAVISAETWLPHGTTEPLAFATHAFDTGAAWASLALQAHHAGWVSHAMGGFDAAVLRQGLAVPAGFHLNCVVAIGKQGDKAMLAEALQAREAPSPRKPLSEIVAEGRFSF
ncbi:MAG: nitroreductase family protein [Burkholderiaceae bacterium]|uniref:nitroreductase family protein n=1 Tax=Paucibacter sp. KCTC 42545 TaxID=1768242 RepID=UPI000733B345|nr:nitroreductase family protein [Paucibacter sp. KCTC 42545]ALT78387.1 NADH dehydrogenase [Paucibacter sp. KCTC 42545]MBY0236905.1 nitroreductase family protein [Burkholderiaceae bacterium]